MQTRRPCSPHAHASPRRRCRAHSSACRCVFSSRRQQSARRARGLRLWARRSCSSRDTCRTISRRAYAPQEGRPGPGAVGAVQGGPSLRGGAALLLPLLPRLLAPCRPGWWFTRAAGCTRAPLPRGWTSAPPLRGTCQAWAAARVDSRRARTSAPRSVQLPRATAARPRRRPGARIRRLTSLRAPTAACWAQAPTTKVRRAHARRVAATCRGSPWARDAPQEREAAPACALLAR